MSDRLVEVCANCKTASCWHGEFMCDESKNSGTVRVHEKELRRLNLEHPSNYSRKRISEVYGDDDL